MDVLHSHLGYQLHLLRRNARAKLSPPAKRKLRESRKSSGAHHGGTLDQGTRRQRHGRYRRDENVDIASFSSKENPLNKQAPLGSLFQGNITFTKRPRQTEFWGWVDTTTARPRATAPPPPPSTVQRRSALIVSEETRLSLHEKYLLQNASLLFIASVGAFILLTINCVGVLFCKGYFKKKIINEPLTPCPHSLTYSRRSRFSQILRRYSIEAPPDPVLEELGREVMLLENDDPVIRAAGNSGSLRIKSDSKFEPLSIKRNLSLQEHNAHLWGTDNRTWRDRLRHTLKSGKMAPGRSRPVFYLDDECTIGRRESDAVVSSCISSTSLGSVTASFAVAKQSCSVTAIPTGYRNREGKGKTCYRTIPSLR